MPAEFLDLGLKIEWGGNVQDDGIFLAANPLESPPAEIVKKGNKAIRQYFQSLAGEEKALNEVKVLLVGDGAAGKTSLAKALLGRPFDKNESQTHGINIDHMEIQVNNTIIKLRLWDFGGQEIMHATHRFFLSKRSIYILVLDGRKDEKTEYWLNHIESFGGDSPVMVVLNKIDENPGFDVNRKFLREKYRGVKGFYRVSCASRDGIKEFTRELKQAVDAVEIKSTRWGRAWFQVKQRLENMNEDFISNKEYRQLCGDANVPDNAGRDTLVEFLNDLGVIVHFKDLELNDTHILQPRWVTEAVYKIINSPRLASGKGVLDPDHLPEILKKNTEDDFEYPLEKYRFITGLMRKFELCYQLGDGRYLVPDLLEPNEPDYEFDSKGALGFIVEYNFLPPGVMPRFIVRRHREIKEKLRWRTGVVLANPGFDAEAVVKSDRGKGLIHIFVAGEQKRDYLAVILNTIREINLSFEKIDAKECVPLPDNPDIAVSYLHLLRLEKKGQVEFLPEGAVHDYNVKELLEGIKPEKERLIEADQLLKNDRIVINIPPQPPPVKVSRKKRILIKVIKIAGIAAGVIAFLAALFALLDSASFKEFIKKLFG